MADEVRRIETENKYLHILTGRLTSERDALMMAIEKQKNREKILADAQDILLKIENGEMDRGRE